MHEALEGLGVHPPQPGVVAQVDMHQSVSFPEHVSWHMAEVVVAQIQVRQALGMEKKAWGKLHQGVVAQIQHSEFHVACEIARRHGRNAVVGQAEVAGVHRQVRGYREQPLTTTVHDLVMTCTKDWAAGTGIRVYHPSCQEEEDQQQGWVGRPGPGKLGPGVAHLWQLAAAML